MSSVRLALVALLLAGVLTPAALAQFVTASLHTFCERVEMGAEPRTSMIVGSDGKLYGTTLLAGGTLKGCVYQMNPDGTGYRMLHRFKATEPDGGSSPYGVLLEASDGYLYGTTFEGGRFLRGVIYRIDRRAGPATVIYHFSGGTNDAANPYGGLVEGNDGALYGTSFLGGSANRGTVFKIARDGTGLTVLKHFSDADGGSAQPTSGLLKGRDGLFYGTTYFGGTSGVGTVFRIEPNGGGFTVLLTFTGGGGEGGHPFAGLLEGADGLLYGTTSAGGQSNFGTIFKLAKDGTGYALVHRFSNLESGGHQPFSPLIQTKEGLLLGTTAFGGINDQGTVFQIATNGTAYLVHRRFQAGTSDGSVAYAGLAQDGEGWIHGVTVTGGPANSGTAFRMRPNGQDYKVTHAFAGTEGEAASPYSALLEGSDGALYGTSFQGGHTNFGTVFSIQPDGTRYRILHSFSGGDGSLPYAGLIESKEGVLYGTAGGGGTNRGGTVFRLNKDGTGFQVLRHFQANVQDGMIPFGRLLEAADGNLYGTTSGDVGNSIYGTLFRMAKDGSGYTVLRVFQGTGGGGTQPFGGLIQGTDGRLYGTTAYRDATNSGTIFRVGADGSGFQTLYSFGNQPDDGTFPFYGLTQASDGMLYGTTFSGGLTNHGTIFRIAPGGENYAVIKRFTGAPSEGSLPSANAGLTEGGDGLLYGVTFAGGNSNLGTLYRLSKDGGSFETLQHFSSAEKAGAQPYGGLTRARNGTIYGTTHSGGTGCGTLFVLAPAATLSLGSPGAVRIQGPAGYRFSIQYSVVLGVPEAWQTLTEVNLSPAGSGVTDILPGRPFSRFYRAVWIR